MSYDEKILRYVDSHKDEVISLLQKLIRTESTTGDESNVARIVAEECKKDGLEVELVEPAPKRVNVIARYHGTVGKPKVMWYSHYDTVPPGELSQWNHPPHSADIADGFLWGRGTSDNKMATCASIIAFRAVKDLGIKLKGDILFTHVCDEEKAGTFGFKHLIDNGYGEGMDCLFYPHGGAQEQVSIAANGSTTFKIIVKAPPVSEATSSIMERERSNAIVEASKLLPRLQKLANEVTTRQYLLPGTDSYMYSRFSINKVHAYLADNLPPKVCELQIDRRWTPAETPELIEGEVRGVIDGLKKDDPKFDAELTIIPGMDLSVSPADSVLVKCIQKSAKKLIGFEPKPGGGSHSSDHGFFNTKYRKPLASYGIGGIRSHLPNERIKVEDVILTTKLHSLVMTDLLGVS
jgi:acetylornithine deacetylase/succinyl-diaminopimelate desuccinylase-like protein